MKSETKKADKVRPRGKRLASKPGPQERQEKRTRRDAEQAERTLGDDEVPESEADFEDEADVQEGGTEKDHGQEASRDTSQLSDVAGANFQ